MASRPTHRSAKNDTQLDASHRASSSDPIAADLSYAEARTALDLALARLQATDLDVEEMAGLFLRARGYAQRCEALLAAVEQQVVVWDSTDPGSEPAPYGADPS